jgi:hypothetical protein
MNRLPPSHDPADDADDRYRRASASDPSRPSEAVRRSVLAYATKLAGRRAALAAPLAAASPRPAPNRIPRRAVIFGALAVAAVAGLMIVPRLRSPTPVPVQTSIEGRSLPEPAPPTVSAPAPAAAPAPAPFPRSTVAESHSARGGTAPGGSGQALEAPLTKQLEPRAAIGGLTAGAPLAKANTSNAVAAPPRAAAQGRSDGSQDSAVAFRRAAENGDLAALQALLGQQSDINARDSLGRTPLMLATLNGQTNAAAALLAYGADPNAADARGTTPLQAALAANQAAIAAALQRYGAR